MKVNQIKMERSPYHIERDEKTTKETRKGIHADVSPEVYEDFMTYVEKANTNKSQALSDLVINFLNNNVFEQRVFRNLNAILLLPKSTNPDEVNEKAQVIGFIDSHEWLDITLSNIFYGGGVDYPLRHNFMHTLKEFNEYNYANFLHYFNKLYGYDDTIFFNIDEETQQDFDKVKSRLSELYEDIDIDDAYFVMFAFNNYLDVLKDGLYMSKSSALEHEGVIVMFEDIANGVFARIKWSYLEGELSFSFEFNYINEFQNRIAPYLSNVELLEDFNSRTQIVSNPEGKLQFKRKITVNEINELDFRIETLMKKRERKLQKLNEIDEEISQHDEDNS